jgi:hypothetical protein
MGVQLVVYYKWVCCLTKLYRQTMAEAASASITSGDTPQKSAEVLNEQTPK